MCFSAIRPDGDFQRRLVIMADTEKTRRGARARRAGHPRPAHCIATARTPAGRCAHGDVGATVRLSGWVHRVRDHGGLLFIDLRDHYGMTQVVADPDSPAFKIAETVRSEWVIRVDGKVRDRPIRREVHGQPRPADRRDRGGRQRDRGAVGGQGAADSRVRRAGLSGGSAPASTASSTCGARRCTATSCCATRSSPRSAGACARAASSSSRRRS